MSLEKPSPPGNPTPPKACGVILFRESPAREFLLMTHPARLDLPKGHIEPGETELECALREMEEETGISRHNVELDPDFRWTTKYPVQSKRTGGTWQEKTLVIFLAWLRRQSKIKPTEHTGHQWLAWRPPHTIQAQTIDPLLASVAEYFVASAK